MLRAKTPHCQDQAERLNGRFTKRGALLWA